MTCKSQISAQISIDIHISTNGYLSSKITIQISVYSYEYLDNVSTDQITKILNLYKYKFISKNHNFCFIQLIFDFYQLNFLLIIYLICKINLNKFLINS